MVQMLMVMVMVKLPVHVLGARKVTQKVCVSFPGAQKMKMVQLKVYVYRCYSCFFYGACRYAMMPVLVLLLVNDLLVAEVSE